MSDHSDLCLLGGGWESLHPSLIPALLSQPLPSENWVAQEPEAGMNQKQENRVDLLRKNKSEKEIVTHNGR